MSWVDEVFEVLSRGSPREISLDEIGEAIGVRFAEPRLIEELFARLEGAGFVVAVPGSADLRERLLRVLTLARTLREAGQSSGLAELAGALGWSVRETRTVLLYGEVLARGRRV